MRTTAKESLLSTQKSNFLVYCIFFLAASGGLLFGYVIGVTSNVVTTQTAADPGGVLCSTTDHLTYDCLDLSNTMRGFLNSISILGALVGTLLCFGFSEVWGRRRQLMLGMIFYTAGALLSYFLPLRLLYLGQLIYGAGAGFSMHAAPSYIAETAPSSIRGKLVSAKEAVIVVGITAGAGIGDVFLTVHSGWRYMLLCPIIFAVPTLIALTLVPSSPRWVYNRTKDQQQTRAVLQRLRSGYGEDEIEEELESIVEVLEQNQNQQQQARNTPETGLLDDQRNMSTKSSFFDVFQHRYRQALFIGCGIVFLQQVTGQPSVLYYATNIFKAAGYGSQSATQTVLISAAKLLFTLVTVSQVDKYGRKALLYIGISMMALSLLMIGIAFTQQVCLVPDVSVNACNTDDLTLPSNWGFVTLISLIVYVGGYQVGFGPIAWLMISEIFPLSVRGAAMSLAVVTNFATNLLVSFFFKDILDGLGSAITFWMYGVWCIVSLIFVRSAVVETKGLSLEEIEDKLVGNYTKLRPRPAKLADMSLKRSSLNSVHV